MGIDEVMYIEVGIVAIIILILMSAIVFKTPHRYEITAPDLPVYGTDDYTIINNNNGSCIKFKSRNGDVTLCGTYQILKGK